MNTLEELDPAANTLLDLRLDRVRQELATHSAPGDLESALLVRFRQRKRQAARPSLWWMPPLALAATVGIVSWIVRAPLTPQLASVAPVAAELDPGPFLALKPLERIALEPGTTVVSTEFPRALLAGWGLPVSPDRAAEPVRAEMLYSAQGEPLAVRLIH